MKNKKKSAAQKKADKAFIEKISTLHVGSGASEPVSDCSHNVVIKEKHHDQKTGALFGTVHCPEHGTFIGTAVGYRRPVKHDDTSEMSVTE